MVEVVADVTSLERSKTGSITGSVFLRGPAGEFPEPGWSDFPVVILGWWIEGLTILIAGKSPSFEGLFMDGPYAFVVERGVGTSGRLAWGRRGHQATVGTLEIAAFLGSALTAGEQVADACRARRWKSRDLDALERAVWSNKQRQRP